MAVHTKHPASAPPAAPVREKTGHLLLRGWCIFVLFMALSGTAWLHAFGELATAVVNGPEAVGDKMRYTFDRAIGSKG